MGGVEVLRQAAAMPMRVDSTTLRSAPLVGWLVSKMDRGRISPGTTVGSRSDQDTEQEAGEEVSTLATAEAEDGGRASTARLAIVVVVSRAMADTAMAELMAAGTIMAAQEVLGMAVQEVLGTAVQEVLGMAELMEPWRLGWIRLW